MFLLSCVLWLNPNAKAQSTSADQPAKGILWEVKSATNTAYLYGALHIGKADFYPLPAAVDAAYRQAGTLAIEVDPTDPLANATMLPLLTYAAPDKLQQHLRPQTWQALKAFAGPAVEQLQTLRPAMLATTFVMQVFSAQGYDPQYGIDLHFIQRAKVDRKKLVELESLQFQAGVLGGLSDTEGDAMVGQILSGMKDGSLQRESTAMIDAWKSGNAEALATVLRSAAEKDAGSKKIMKRLFDDRNIGMAQKITHMMDAGDTLFAVVGAGHIVGAGSVTDLLQKQGFAVRQIK